MTQAQWEALIAAEMRRAGLTGWSITWDRARRRGGFANSSTKTLSFSRPLFCLWDDDARLEVIRHEIAHALVGPGHHHDRVWKRMALSLGASGSTLLPADLPKVDPTWQATCPTCGTTFDRFRRPTIRLECRHPNGRSGTLTWVNTKTGESLLPPLRSAQRRRRRTPSRRRG